MDTKSFRSITFLVLFGTIDPSAVTTCKLQQSSDDGSLDAYSDLTGTSIAVADDDDNQVVALEVDEPLKHYVRCVVSRGTADAVVDGIVALQYNADSEPVAHDGATCVGSEYHHARPKAPPDPESFARLVEAGTPCGRREVIAPGGRFFCYLAALSRAAGRPSGLFSPRRPFSCARP